MLWLARQGAQADEHKPHLAPTSITAAEIDQLEAIAAAAEAKWDDWPSPPRTRFIGSVTPTIVRRLIAALRPHVATPQSPEAPDP